MDTQRMKHCIQGAKPLQGFGGAAPMCRGLVAQFTRFIKFGAQPPKVQRVQRAQTPRMPEISRYATGSYLGVLDNIGLDS